MFSLKRSLAALAVPALLAVSLSACGSGGSEAAGGDISTSTPSATGAPTDASVSDFCDSFTAVQGIQNPKDAAAELAGTGTPSDMPADARQGYAVLLDKAASADTEADLESLQPSDLSTEDQSDIEAFARYIAKTCTDLGGSTGSTTAPAPSSTPS